MFEQNEKIKSAPKRNFHVVKKKLSAKEKISLLKIRIFKGKYEFSAEK